MTIKPLWKHETSGTDLSQRDIKNQERYQEWLANHSHEVGSKAWLTDEEYEQYLKEEERLESGKPASNGHYDYAQMKGK